MSLFVLSAKKECLSAVAVAKADQRKNQRRDGLDCGSPPKCGRLHNDSQHS